VQNWILLGNTFEYISMGPSMYMQVDELQYVLGQNFWQPRPIINHAPGAVYVLPTRMSHINLQQHSCTLTRPPLLASTAQLQGFPMHLIVALSMITYTPCRHRASGPVAQHSSHICFSSCLA
jgi:hypothetical protein